MKNVDTSQRAGRNFSRRGFYSSLGTRSLIGNGDKSSVVEQTLVGTTFRLLLFLLFLDFGSLRFDLAGTRERAVLLTLQTC